MDFEYSFMQRFWLFPVSKDFIRLGPLALLWINFSENFNNIKIRNSHNIIHWKSKLYIHNINIIHKHGTCLKASALREIENTYVQTD